LVIFLVAVLIISGYGDGTFIVMPEVQYPDFWSCQRQVVELRRRSEVRGAFCYPATAPEEGADGRPAQQTR
jgi:hypothetical protein